MSYYDDRRTSTRDRRRSDDYYDDSVYANTRENQRSTAIVKRRSDSPDYDEEVRRDFSPGGGGYYRETITRKSGIRPQTRARSYDDDRYDDDRRSFASTRRDSYYGGGARSRRSDEDRRRRSRYDSDYSSRSRSRTPPKRERRKSVPEQALEALGLGGVAAAIMGKKSRSRSRSSSSGRRSTRSKSRRDRSDSDHRKEQLQQALKAAVLAGAASAFRARHEDGGWGGEKGRRVLTAALTAGGVDGFVNRDKDPDKHQFRDTIGSALAGVATDRLVNGPSSRPQSRGPNGSPNGRRSRSRSRVRDLAAGGAIAAAAKKAADSFRGRSSSRGPDRDRSVDSYGYDSRDSRSPPPRRSRSRSVIAGGLSKIGLNSQADKIDPQGARERSKSRSGGGRRPSSRDRAQSRYADDDYVDDRRGSSIYDPPNNFNGRGSSIYDNRDVGNSRSLDPQTGAMISRPQSVGPGGGVLSPPPPGYRYETTPHQYGDPETDSESDLGSSTDEEKRRKKGRKRLVISGGLATVATIHAGHSVQQSMEKREARKKAVHDGTISKEEAKKHKTRDRMQDAASLGLAALGIKGAYSEWKELKEYREEIAEEKEKHDRHARKRDARRRKSEMVGVDPNYSNSAPNLSSPFYDNTGFDEHGRQHYFQQGTEVPYMSGANGEYRQPDPTRNGMGSTPQYYDGNPYGSMAYQQGAGQGYDGNSYGAGNYPPPPGGQPPPPQGR